MCLSSLCSAWQQLLHLLVSGESLNFNDRVLYVKTVGVLHCAVLDKGAPGSLKPDLPAHIRLVPLSYRIGVCKQKDFERFHYRSGGGGHT